MKSSVITRLVVAVLGIIILLVGIITGVVHKKKTEDFNNGWNYYAIAVGVVFILSALLGPEVALLVFK